MTRLTPELLVQQTRSNQLETEYYGYIVYCGKNKEIKTFGNTQKSFFFHRSCSKPLQASLICDYGTKDYYNLSDEEIAVCCASHTGEEIHTNLIKGILKKANLSEKDLLCPAIAPLSEKEQKKFTTYSKLHNNCSGKHALMLAICRQQGWDIKNYLDRNHPLQTAVYNKIKTLCEADYELPFTLDGCTAPNYATTLEDFAKGFGNLFFSPKYEIIKKAFMKNPIISGGENRLDSQLMMMNNKLAAKVGAGGLCYVANTETKEVLGFKIVDANMHARSIAVTAALIKLGWIDINSIEKKLLDVTLDKFVKTETGEIVGEYSLYKDVEAWLETNILC